MKKVLALVLALLTLTLVFSACGTTQKPEETKAAETKDEDKKSEGVMTYAQYDAAAKDSKVTIETYIQARQGGYFLYNMPCTEAEYAKLVPGTKIKVEGYKSEWSGEIEITDATFTIIEGKTKTYDAKDITAKLGTDEIVKFQNQRVKFKGLFIAASQNAAGAEAAFLYKWDGSGQAGDDLYFKVTDNTNTYTFVVESYLCGKDTAVYKAIEGLKVGDKVDLEGFLYWYEGAQPHITDCTVISAN